MLIYHLIFPYVRYLLKYFINIIHHDAKTLYGKSISKYLFLWYKNTLKERPFTDMIDG